MITKLGIYSNSIVWSSDSVLEFEDGSTVVVEHGDRLIDSSGVMWHATRCATCGQLYWSRTRIFVDYYCSLFCELRKISIVKEIS